jgi:hypothetical protein
MSGQREQSRRGSEERYASVRAEQRGWALPCRHRRLRSPVADAGRDLPLPKPFKGAILASKPRASGECRLKSCRSSAERRRLLPRIWSRAATRMRRATMGTLRRLTRNVFCLARRRGVAVDVVDVSYREKSSCPFGYPRRGGCLNNRRGSIVRRRRDDNCGGQASRNPAVTLGSNS